MRMMVKVDPDAWAEPSLRVLLFSNLNICSKPQVLFDGNRQVMPVRYTCSEPRGIIDTRALLAVNICNGV